MVSKKDSKLAIIYNGEAVALLNATLIKSRKISNAGIERIKKLHCDLFDVYTAMEVAELKPILRDLFKRTTEIEFKLQAEWGFELDSRRHYWYKVPKCSCPRMDNEDAAPYRQYIDRGCIIHGD